MCPGVALRSNACPGTTKPRLCRGYGNILALYFPDDTLAAKFSRLITQSSGGHFKIFSVDYCTMLGLDVSGPKSSFPELRDSLFLVAGISCHLWQSDTGIRQAGSKMSHWANCQ